MIIPGALLGVSHSYNPCEVNGFVYFFAMVILKQVYKDTKRFGNLSEVTSPVRAGARTRMHI